MAGRQHHNQPDHSSHQHRSVSPWSDLPVGARGGDYGVSNLHHFTFDVDRMNGEMMIDKLHTFTNPIPPIPPVSLFVDVPE